MIRQTARFRATALTLMISLGALWATSAQAASDSPLNHLYYGVKAGLLLPDIGYMDNAVNVGGFVGAPFARVPAGTFSGEVEATITVIKGNVNIFGNTGHWHDNTLAGYGVFTTNGPMYFKAKAGFIIESVGMSVGGATGYGSGSGLSFGVGGGMRLRGGQSIELEYTILDSDVSFLSVGYKF